jgi:DNA-binding MarR family transcriptional regulator
MSTIYTNNRGVRYTFLQMSETATKHETTQGPPPGFPDELLASAMFLLKRLGMAAKERTMPAFEEAGLHPYHHAILAVLDEGSRETQGSIADALGYDKSQLVGLLDELEGEGLIERRRDTTDRRRQIVRITPAGRKTLEKLRRISRQLEDEFLAPLDAAERRELHELLLRLGRRHLPNCRLP